MRTKYAPRRTGEQPHMRGELVPDCCASSTLLGTTPRARGKANRHRLRPGLLRNNPACAGKPQSPPMPACVTGEQPRVRGENRARFTARPNHIGTTPRTRGKGAEGLTKISHSGNNPEYAGKRLRDQRVCSYTIEFSDNFARPTRPAAATTAACRNQHVLFVPDRPSQRRGTCLRR